MPNEKTKKTKWALKVSIFSGVAALLGGIIFFATVLQNTNSTIQINAHKIAIEVADTPNERERGLCCRENLDVGHGMLFVYDTAGNHRFWMKDTKIALDMVWIDSSREIVHIEDSVQPSSYPKTFGTNVPSQYVLEVNAGYIKAHALKVGDTVKF